MNRNKMIYKNWKKIFNGIKIIKNLRADELIQVCYTLYISFSFIIFLKLLVQRSILKFAKVIHALSKWLRWTLWWHRYPNMSMWWYRYPNMSMWWHRYLWRIHFFFFRLASVASTYITLALQSGCLRFHFRAGQIIN